MKNWLIERRYWAGHWFRYQFLSGLEPMHWLSRHLPDRLVYFCGITLWGSASSGEWSNETPLDLTMDTVLERWVKKTGIHG